MKKTISLIMLILMVSSVTVPAYSMEIIGNAGAGSETLHSYAESAPQKTGGCTVPQSAVDHSGETIKEGVFAGPVDLSGMTQTDAVNAVINYVSGLAGTDISLVCVSGNTVPIKASDLGFYWKNTEIADYAVSLGRSGNIIKRFKDVSDLKRTNKVFELELAADRDKIRNILETKCAAYDVVAKDATMSRSDGSFNIVPGHDGQAVNVDEAIEKIEQFLSTGLADGNTTIELPIEVTKPKGDAETLGKLTDVLGTFTTKYYSSGKDRCTNVANGCRLINGHTLYPGEQMSVSQTISPMTEENGYALAGSYLNGLVVESFGGGICQVSTTLYQAVLRAELQVDERYNHSMVVNYVAHSGDAAIAEGIKDFKFTNNKDTPVYIEGYTTPDKTITFTIYGIETRPSNRTLEFESVDLEEMEPTGEKVVADSTLPAGTTRKQSAHIGYKSEYYKIVKVDGEEKERILVNRSTYQAVPAILTVGTATDDPTVKQILKDAIATQNIEYCKAIASGQAVPLPGTPTEADMAAMAAAAAAAAQTDSGQ
jgi:vancomycin resistance protein YoaR